MGRGSISSAGYTLAPSVDGKNVESGNSDQQNSGLFRRFFQNATNYVCGFTSFMSEALTKPGVKAGLGFVTVLLAAGGTVAFLTWDGGSVEIRGREMLTPFNKSTPYASGTYNAPGLPYNGSDFNNNSSYEIFSNVTESFGEKIGAGGEWMWEGCKNLLCYLFKGPAYLTSEGEAANINVWNNFCDYLQKYLSPESFNDFLSKANDLKGNNSTDWPPIKSAQETHNTATAIAKMMGDYFSQAFYNALNSVMNNYPLKGTDIMNATHPLNQTVNEGRCVFSNTGGNLVHFTALETGNSPFDNYLKGIMKADEKFPPELRLYPRRLTVDPDPVNIARPICV